MVQSSLAIRQSCVPAPDACQSFLPIRLLLDRDVTCCWARALLANSTLRFGRNMGAVGFYVEYLEEVSRIKRLFMFLKK